MTNTLPIKAKVLIGTVALASMCPLWFGFMHWRMSAGPQLALLMVAAVLSSRLKVKLPGMTGSMSGSLPVILLAVMQLGLLGSLFVAAVGAVAQSWASANKTKPIQFLFNTCTLMNASALAYVAFHSRQLTAFGGSGLALAMAAAAYFLANTAPVAGIIGLTESNSPFAIWHKVLLWSFPNYVIGAGLTAIASLFTITGMATMAALMVVLFGVHRSYKMYTGGLEQTATKTMAMAAGQ